MVCKIIWSPKAISTYISIIDYLRTEWTNTEADVFIKRVDAKLKLLSSQPKIGRLIIRHKKVYRTVLHKRTTLVYHYYPIKKQIELITFWNNYMDPNKMPI